MTDLRGRLCGLLTLYVHTTGPSGPSPPVRGEVKDGGGARNAHTRAVNRQRTPPPASYLPLTGGAGPEDEVWRAGTAPDNTTPAARRNGETTRGGADGYVRGAAKRATARRPATPQTGTWATKRGGTPRARRRFPW
ncbi:hypothetical protein HEK616_02930 [Streptomyces nigrescens]|uniref:Uncharacterized protein n=1 Tax=Streptomyces nigrescens TaxID=1920 RepID=A0ABN6QQ43_STRNI|nr:hypothetical protein HEK616_02930 [Streptomyces nigrescens]